MNKPLSTSLFGNIATHIMKRKFGNLKIKVFEKHNLSNENFVSTVRKLYKNANFEKYWKPSDIDYILGVVDIKTNTPVSILVLRKYNYTPGIAKQFLHIEFAITSPQYEGQGLITLLTKMCLAFAFDRNFGGVSSYLISHGTQISFTRLGFKPITVMKHSLLFNNNNKIGMREKMNKQGIKLSPSREKYYTQQRMTLRLKKLIGKAPRTLMKVRNSPLNEIAKERIDKRRAEYTSEKHAFINLTENELENQYLAEVLLKNIPNKTKQNGYLNTGMSIKGLPNMTHSLGYIPWISHIFTFASQKRKLQSVCGDILSAIEKEKTKPVRSFTPRVKASSKRKRSMSPQ